MNLIDDSRDSESVPSLALSGAKKGCTCLCVYPVQIQCSQPPKLATSDCLEACNYKQWAPPPQLAASKRTRPPSQRELAAAPEATSNKSLFRLFNARTRPAEEHLISF